MSDVPRDDANEWITNPKRFPEILYLILDNAVNEAIISWLQDGESWIIYQRDALLHNLLCRYSKMNQFKSFQRQLTGWGFTRHTWSTQNDVYSHPLFKRGRKDLIAFMQRQSSNNEAIVASPNILEDNKPLKGSNYVHISENNYHTMSLIDHMFDDTSHERSSTNDCRDTYHTFTHSRVLFPYGVSNDSKQTQFRPGIADELLVKEEVDRPENIEECLASQEGCRGDALRRYYHHPSNVNVARSHFLEDHNCVKCDTAMNASENGGQRISFSGHIRQETSHVRSRNIGYRNKLHNITKPLMSYSNVGTEGTIPSQFRSGLMHNTIVKEVVGTSEYLDVFVSDEECGFGDASRKYDYPSGTIVKMTSEQYDYYYNNTTEDKYNDRHS